MIFNTSKKIIFFVLLCVLFSPCFALDIAGLAANNSTYYDSSFLYMLSTFFTYRIMFYNIAKTISVSIAVIGAFWWVMKIILMGENVEKAITDIVTKCIIYVVLVMVYPKIVDSALSLGTNIGLSKTVPEIAMQFTKMTEEIQQQANAAINLLKDGIYNGYLYTGITESEINSLAKEFQMDQKYADSLKETIASLNIQVYKGSGKLNQTYNTVSKEVETLMSSYKTAETAYDFYKGANYITEDGNTNTDSLNPQEAERVKAVLEVNEYVWAAKERLAQSFYGSRGDGVTLNDAMTRLNALLSTCLINDGKSKEDVQNYIQEHIANLKEIDIRGIVTYSPYMSDGHGNLILSPAAILKTSTLVASMCNAGTAASVNQEVETDTSEKASKSPRWLKKTIKVIKNTVLSFTYKHILTIVLDLFINVCTILSAVYFTIQYIMMMLEYYIVTAIGYLLLPLILWEVSSSYAKNIIKLLVSYFFKIMVMCICLGFAWSQYFHLAAILSTPGSGSIMLFTDPWTLVTTVFFTLGISLAFVGEAPKIAQTIISGNPDMSMGEFMKQAMVLGKTAHIGKKAVEKGVKTSVKTAGKVASGVAGVAGMMAGAGAAGAAKTGEVSAAKAMQAKAAGEHSTALGNQKSAMAKESAASGKLSSAQSNLGAAEQKSEGAKGKLDSAKSKLASAEQKFAQAKGKKNKQKAKQDVNSAKNDVVLAQSEYDTAEKERHQRQDEYNTAQAEYTAANDELLDANSEVQRTSNFLNASNAAVKRTKKLNGAGSYVGNALRQKVSNSTVRLLKLDQGAQEYKNGQWQNKTASSKSGYMQYQRDKARAMFDEQDNI